VAVWRYPCRFCGLSTEGADTYVICASCLAELDFEARHERRRRAPSDDCVGPTLSADEIEARLRKLLDDW
jgi:hypothetical protein